MPLPSDEKLLALGEDFLKLFDGAFGYHPGFRPVHAKGLLLSGSFTPAPAADALTHAPHIVRASTPVVVRFSNSTGLPAIPDNDPNADPRGFAIRFQLGEHQHTDIIAHSADGFPTRTPQEFLEFLRAAGASQSSTESPSPIEKFLGAHPGALAFVQLPKPAPASFAKEAYFGVTAFRFINRQGVARYGRYRITPKAGIQHLDAAVAAARDPEFLFTELRDRVAASPILFDISVQVAADGDVVDDATIHWPSIRPIVAFGTVALNALVTNEAAEQKKIIFDPIPRVDGLEPSGDPLLELRAALYLMSGRRRRQAPETQQAATAKG